jgi:aspartate-semialdehyde dehydrogenase
VRVPTFYGSALALNVETETPMAADDIRGALGSAPGLTVTEEREGHSYATPADTIDTDPAYVGRVRCNPDLSTTDLWVALDSIRKGSAVNAVQIAELLLREHL